MKMLTGVVLLYVWAVVALLVSITLMIIGTVYVVRARRYHGYQKKILETVEKRTKEKYNRVALMEPLELRSFIYRQFHRCLELEATSRISSKDPEQKERLYAHAMVKLQEFVGHDTMEALRYYYGGTESDATDVLSRWCIVHYRLLDSRGMIDRIINNEARAEELDRFVAEEKTGA